MGGVLPCILLARAVGLWPWADVFRSGEIENLLLALLSGGVVGIGDALGEENPGLLHRAVRADGLLVKADTPIVPTDQTLIREAKGENPPLICSTSSDFGAWKGVYVFAFSPGADKDITLAPGDLGIGSRAFLLDVATGAGHWLKKGEAFRDRMAGYRDYYVLVPVGPSGVAFLGDEGNSSCWKKEDRFGLRRRIVARSGDIRPGEGPFDSTGSRPNGRRSEVEAGRAGTLEYQSATGSSTCPSPRQAARSGCPCVRSEARIPRKQVSSSFLPEEALDRRVGEGGSGHCSRAPRDRGGPLLWDARLSREGKALRAIPGRRETSSSWVSTATRAKP